ARRTGCGPGHGRARQLRFVGASACRRRPRRVVDRARCRSRAEGVRSRRGPRLREDHRRRVPGRDPLRSTCGGGVPRHGGGDTVSGGLEVRGVSAGYGHITVLRDVGLTVEPGEICCMLGPNGAGETTLLLSCVGQLPLKSGSVLVDGQPMSSRRASRAAALGIGFVPDNRGLFLQLTVAENLKLVHPWRSSLDEVADLFPALPPLMSRQVGLLSGGEQQMVAIAKAVLFRPRLLLIDELTHGLAAIVAEKL